MRTTTTRRSPAKNRVVVMVAVTTIAMAVFACASIVDLQSSAEAPEVKPPPTPANPTPGGPRSDAGDAGFEGDGGQQSSTLRCGNEDCVVGRDICCVQGATAKCIQGESCPMTGPVDAGVDAAKQPPPLKCTSYTQCSNYQACCYHPDEGSKCTGNCNFPRISLCTGFDWCTLGTSCQSMSNPPAPNVKQCR
jgi:hypothetical protein